MIAFSTVKADAMASRLTQAGVFALIFIFTSGAAIRAAEIPQHLRVCGDETEWPPYTYFQREHGIQTGQVTGYNIDLLRMLLAQRARTVEFVLLPWKRCLSEITAGKIDMALDAMISPERKKVFVYPRSNYSMTPIAIYLRRDGRPRLSSMNDFLPLKRCELLGWDYSDSGIPASRLSVGQPPTLLAAAEMMRSRRCDILLYTLERLKGDVLLEGTDPLPTTEFDYLELSWVPRTHLYIAVGRGLLYGDDLAKLIDEGLVTMDRSGATAMLKQKYSLP